MNIAELQNPFVISKLDNTVSLPPGDVPELHAGVLRECATALAASRLTGQSTSLLVVGEAGSGKSHMIAQFRRQIGSDPGAVLAAIRLGGANAGCLWRHLRCQLFSELLATEASNEIGGNGIMRILRNRFPKWVAKTGSGSSVLDVILGRSEDSSSLTQYLDDFARGCPTFGHKLRVVLAKLTKKDLATLAQDWLRGEQLGADELTRLGLPPEFPSDMEQETIARSVVLSLFELAGDKTALFLFFDEVEAIQAGNHDAAVLRQFGTLATDLLTANGKRVIAISIRPELQIKLQKAVEKSNFQKISHYKATIHPLTWEHTIRIVRCRLDAEATCKAGRTQHSQDPDWPLGTKFLNSTFTENRRSLTPRHLIRACRVEFDRLKEGRPRTTVIVPDPEPKKTAKATVKVQTESTDLRLYWEMKRKAFLKKPQSIHFDNVLALGMPWLVELADFSVVSVEDRDPRLGDVNLVFQPTASRKKAIGISFCNQEPKFLWHRLERLIKQWKIAKNVVLAELVILQSEATVIKPGSETRLEKLSLAGARVIQIHIQQLAELAAFQTMLTETMEGDLTRHGKPLDAKELDGWASENLAESVKELLQLVFEPESAKASVESTTTEKKKRITATR